MVKIRPEQPKDVGTVRKVNEAAFEQTAEANIVDSVRAACAEAVSLVAVEDDTVVGHILFSPVIVLDGERVTSGMGLGPMAVLPERQRQGIGSLLVRTGIEALRKGDCPFVVVVGYPEYYPRFAFVPASMHSLSCQWEEVPDEAFMVAILDAGVMAEVCGTARYRDEFAQAT